MKQRVHTLTRNFRRNRTKTDSFKFVALNNQPYPPKLHMLFKSHAQQNSDASRVVLPFCPHGAGSGPAARSTDTHLLGVSGSDNEDCKHFAPNLGSASTLELNDDDLRHRSADLQGVWTARVRMRLGPHRQALY